MKLQTLLRAGAALIAVGIPAVLTCLVLTGGSASTRAASTFAAPKRCDIISDDRVPALYAWDLVSLPAEPVAEAVNSYSKRVRHLNRRAADPRLLIMHGSAVDPLVRPPVGVMLPPEVAKDLPHEVSAELTRLNRRSAYIVQFVDPVTRTVREAVKAAGMDVAGFLPNRALIVAVPAGEEARLDRLGGVRFHMHFDGSLRLDPTLPAALAALAPDEEAILEATALPGEKPSLWLNLLKAAGTSGFTNINDEPGALDLKFKVKGRDLKNVIGALARLEGLEWARVFHTPKTLNSGSTWLLQSGTATLKLNTLFDMGLIGWGQVYASADSGLDTDACQFRYSADAEAQTFAVNLNPPLLDTTNPDGKVIAYYVFAGAAAYDEVSGHWHGTQTNGCGAGDNYAHLATETDPGLDPNDGMAPAAKIVFQDIGNLAGELVGLYSVDPFSMHRQTRESGARVHNNSYGAERANDYDMGSRILDSFSWEYSDYLIFFSAGNSGPAEMTLGGEGSTAKSTLCVGASLPGWSGGGEDLINFSSRGPTTDGRLKPDIVAPGIIYSASETLGKDENGHSVSQTDPPDNNCSTAVTGGTSFSSPTAAGMGLLVREYFTDGFHPSGERNAADSRVPTSALMRAVIINSGRGMLGQVMRFGRGGLEPEGPLAAVPSIEQGWGRMALDDALYFKGDRRDLTVLADQTPDNVTDSMTTGKEAEYEIHVKPDETLKITLTWNDFPGVEYSGKALVNDLDLEVFSPAGKKYLGNAGFKDGWCSPAGETDEPDRLNSVENVFVKEPAAGAWRIVVKGTSVPGGGDNHRPFDSTYQAYTLIAVGDIGEAPDQLLPRVRIRELMVSGGCDGDSALDRSESVTLSMYISNGGDAPGDGTRGEIEIAPDSDLGPDVLTFPNGSTVHFEGVPPRAASSVSVYLDVADSDQATFGKTARFIAKIFDAEGALIQTRNVEFPVQADLNTYRETVEDVKPVCNPAPKVDSIDPACLTPGGKTSYLTIKGANLTVDATVTFDPDVLTWNRLARPNPGELQLYGVAVASDAPEGPVKLTLSTGEGRSVEADGLLEIKADCSGGPAMDGDVVLTDGGDTDETGAPAETAGGSSGGCAQTAGGSWTAMAGLLMLALAILRRRKGSL